MSKISRLPDRDRRAAPQIYEQLHDRILSLDLLPGRVLSRQGLQEEFGVSQTPVRDALMRLEQASLVEVFPQHATVVARIDVAAARQAQFLRLSVELECVERIATQPSETAIMRLSMESARLQEAARHDDTLTFHESDRAFHALLYELADVPALLSLVSRNGVHIDRLRRLNLPMPGKRKAVLEDHQKIMDAIRNADPQGARAALRQHLGGTLSIIEEISRLYPDYLVNV